MRERKPISPLYLFIFLFFFFSLSHSATPGDTTVIQKLAGLLSPTPSTWTGSDPCQWSGISCNGGQVQSISLASKSLSGSLPSDLNQLSSLISLSLQNNTLSGPLPSLSNLSNLQEVYLDSNQFTSIPPNFFSGLTSLQTFSVNQNPLLPWVIPNDLSAANSLTTFYASNASVTGSIPDFFGTLPSLQSLRLSYNNLTGGLPLSFATSGIQNLWLNNQQSDAKLSGPIGVLGSMTQLLQVWLHSNSFSGPIPDLSKCTSLFDLQLRDNRLVGIVPNSLYSISSLVNVSLGNNMLQGPYPSFSSRVTIDKSMGINNFCNVNPGPCDPRVMVLLSVEEGFGYPSNLANAWSGNDPCKAWSFVSCDTEGKSITVLNLANQHLVGTISPAIANLTSLKSLILSNNNLTGSIPDSLTSLPQLQTLDVSNNNLSGNLPVFGGNVTVKTVGNLFIGINLTPSGGQTTPGSNGPSPASNSGGNTNSSSSSGGRRVWLPIVIVAVILCLIVVLGLSYFKYRQSSQKKFKQINSPLNGSEMGKIGLVGMNGNGGITSEKHSEISSGRSEMQLVGAGSMSFSIHDLRQVTNNFSGDNILGRGGFGVVYKGELGGTKIAVKRMESAVISNKGMGEFQAEIAVLTKVRHRHLVALLGYCVEGNEKLLVYEYMPQGTLSQHLFEYKDNGYDALSWKQRLIIALDVARGVEYLHSLAQESFIHRDLKPSNVLLGDDMRAKVSDFGLVKHAPDGKFSVETRLAGTFGYLAPEYCATGRVTTKADVYSFGVILMELVTGRKALDDSQPDDRTHLVTWFRRVLINKDNMMKAVDPILNPDEETFASICKVAELAGHCTVREPYQRPDMSHAVNILSPLVEEWKPTQFDEEDGLGTDFQMSLPQALQRWQDNEGTSMTSDMLYSHQRSLENTQSSIPTKPAGFADTFDSMDCR
ncbi:receptor-like kinase TMK4 [Tasmannia lanceolata]|uniref:receptor-like kinase TMK4 n=1 Tax=Tasmannia lanceolata TaxID=3420 RepID=UPI0040649319